MMVEETDVLTTPRDYIRWGASRFEEAGLFYGHGTDNAVDEATLLVLPALHLPSDLAVGYLNARLTVSERAEVLDLLQRRVDERLPAAYLMGTTRFAGLDFYVNRYVLIPRSPIAELIESTFEPWIQPDTVERVLDWCTASGCIATR
ncbi:MAG: 50S ribosomal protein L3 N(5)-glutamine methyltransferase, partial [Halobacteria archaeon]|nr:50S ribosomal protein L3 N(5)-glutamine methyltransferase [Halobacteria archaeon]